jgi:hypothetical protein
MQSPPRPWLDEDRDAIWAAHDCFTIEGKGIGAQLRRRRRSASGAGTRGEYDTLPN